jgi:hypothetical protein
MMAAGLLESGLLEVVMLLCFAAAWPVSIVKALRCRTAEGKSVVFTLVVLAGYLFGIANKSFIGHVDYVILFYLLNVVLIAVDVAIWLRNRGLDRAQWGNPQDR